MRMKLLVLLVAASISCGVMAVAADYRSGRGSMAGLDATAHDLDRLVLGLDHERQRAAAALAHHHHHPPLAGLVLGQPAVHPVLLVVRRLDVAAEVGAVDLDLALGP